MTMCEILKDVKPCNPVGFNKMYMGKFYRKQSEYVAVRMSHELGAGKMQKEVRDRLTTNFSDRLNEAVKERGLTLTSLSKMIEISEGTLKGYSSNGKLPTMQTLCEIAEVLNVSIDWMVGRTDRKKVL